MKTQIDIITGFLGSGKTTFINGIFEKERLLNKKIVIIQCESGEIEIDNWIKRNRNVYVKKPIKTIDTQFICDIIDKYQPYKIIIEYNGMSKLEDLITVLEDRTIRKNCVINKIVHNIDALTFDVFMKNMGAILTEQLSNSDLIVINNTDDFSKDKLNKMERSLKAINKSAKIVRILISNDKNAFRDNAMQAENILKSLKKSDILFAIFVVLTLAYFTSSVLKVVDFNVFDIDLSWLQVLNTVFLSILIQAIPFVFIGVFVSSILQVFVSTEAITKIFPRKMGLGFIVAILAGVFFPVCDCAMLPVAARLVKKGVPLPSAVTFMLAAPIVNPIVIASTFYAFPGQPSIAFYRVFLGVVIALAAGLMFLFFPEDNSVLLNDIDNYTCSCGSCGEDYSKKSILGKIDAIFRHAGSEFFEVGRFIIIGAFLSSIVQVFVPKDILANIGGGYPVKLLIMMLSAFVLSVCSTSDAFIARTFTNQFPMGAVMGFMILGPMIDIKNLLILFGSFKRRFVVKLIFVIFGVSFAVLMVLTTLLFGR